MKRFEDSILVMRPYLSLLEEFEQDFERIWSNQRFINNGPILKKFRQRFN